MNTENGCTHLTLDEAAARLRLSRWSLYRDEWKQRLRVVKVGGRLLVPVEAVEEVLSPPFAVKPPENAEEIMPGVHVLR